MKKFTAYLASMFFAFSVYAADEVNNHAQVDDHKAKYQQVVDEYKKYLTTVDKAVIDEIKSFRIEMAKLRQQKKDLYKKL